MTLGTASPDPHMRDVVADLVQARDAKIAQVVAMVDSMPDRGQADALIAPLRARLAQLRPTRPFGFTRLLFSPLDPVIVPGPRWRRGHVGIPRPALAPLGRVLQAALPDLSTSLEARVARVAPNDRATIAALGADLWPAAAKALQAIRPPADWTAASGLVAADFTELAGVVAAILGHASAIETLAARPGNGDGSLRDLLASADKLGGLALGTMVSVLLARLPDPGRVLAVGAEISVSLRGKAADQAMDHTLASLQAAMSSDGADATEAAVAAARVASMLDGMEEAASPERRRRADEIRRDADALCRRRFDHAVAAAFAPGSAPSPAECDDETIAGLESAARDLRQLESAGRRLGSGEHYDAMVQAAAGQFRDDRNGLGLADRVRMVEILAGPDEALALLLASPG